MEELENNEIVPEEPAENPAELVTQPEAEESCYHDIGTGRKEETFAAFHVPQEPIDKEKTYYQQPCQPEPKKEKKRGRVWKTVLAAVLILALVAGSCTATYFVTRNAWQREVASMKLHLSNQIAALEKQLQERPSGSVGAGSLVIGEGLSPSQVYAQNIDSIVSVTCTQNGGTSMGSGFIITADGFIVTNFHVVEGATSVSVTKADGTTLKAQVKGYDQTNDVAVLKVDGVELKPVKLGSSSELVVGDMVIAIGNALGELSFSLTVGYVSGMDREITTEGAILNMIQTDTAINSGNSGGPLFNARGEVVGITTAKYSGNTPSGASIDNISFAIPMDDVKGMIQDLCQYGYVTGAYLGVIVSDVSQEAQFYGVPAGAYVREVSPGNCAEAAGVRAGDIIVELGGIQVRSLNDLSRALRNFKAGETSTILIWRSGVELVLTVVFDEKPAVTG